jgi:hypothetical protein
MKLKLVVGALFASAVLAATGLAPAMAQNTSTPRIDRAHDDVSARIQHGIRSGHLTPREARSLQRRERAIERHDVRFKFDGVVTRQERRQLTNEVATLRYDVERMMRNDRHARHAR